MDSSGFYGDGFGGERVFALSLGTVIDRNDPEGDGRVRVRIPGIMEQSNWAKPKGGGYAQWGSNDVPPLGADVYIQFLNGNPEMPIYELADHGMREISTQEGPKPERFPEFENPDVHVWGRGPFRLVIDNQEGQRQALLKVVKMVGSEEEDVAYILFNYEDNSIEIHADSAVGVSGTILDVDCATVQMNGRKLVPNGKPIN